MTGGYGAGPDILHDCTIAVNPGEIAVIVGPNGAGKSTAMKAVFGMLNVRKGSVRLDGEDITDLSPQARVLKGMGFVPQTSNIFTSLTVEENLEMGAFIREDDIRETMEQVYHPVPDPEGQAPPGRGRAFGRAAPAGRRGPRADDPAQGPDAGRTHRRRLAHRDGRAVRPDHRGLARTGIADPDGRAERPPGAGDRRQG
jgi:branched-chain amino acid transport system ATP-binding protein